MKFRRNLNLFIALTLCVLLTPLYATTIYVDDDAPGANNGTSWFHAYRYLQDALATAKAGDEIRIAQGIYKPHLSSSSIIPNRYASFTLKNGVEVKGGYYGYNFGSTIAPDTRNIHEYVTYLSGDILGNDNPVDTNDLNSIDMEDMLTHQSRLDNSYTVVDANSTDSTAILDGCTIIAGNANHDVITNLKNVYCRAGGFASVGGQATIIDCNFTLNSGYEGGAIYNNSSRHNIYNTTFSKNYASDYGGAIYSLDDQLKIDTCEFNKNISTYGAAIYQVAGDAIITDSNFLNNDAGLTAGAIYATENLTVENCTFEDNSAWWYGGAIYTNSQLKFEQFITGCLFLNNNSDVGGAYCAVYSNPTFTQCYFVGNTATESGGVLDAVRGHYTLINCLMNGNYASKRGGAINLSRTTSDIINSTFAHNYVEDKVKEGNSLACTNESVVEVQNSILWSGAPEVYVQNEVDNVSILNVAYTTISEYWPGAGNNFLNPQFADPNGPDNIPGTIDDDLRPINGSPCVDSGNNLFVPENIEVDLDLNPRFQEDPGTPNTGVPSPDHPEIVDRGAYEWTHSSGSKQPVADAGKDQTLYTNSTGTFVTLDGSGSYDPDGRPLSYTWRWSNNEYKGVNPTLYLPIGTHYIQLVVNNGSQDSLPDYVVVTVIQSGSQVPIAHAGEDQTVSVGSNGQAEVTLDGSQSTEPNGRPLSYEWTWTIGNQNWTATGMTPQIELPVGVHTITLVVSNGQQSSAPDYVEITVIQDKPTADAGKDQEVHADNSGNAYVTLDSSGSSAPPGQSITSYTWWWTIDNTTEYRYEASPTINLPVGVHTIYLVVRSNTGASSEADTVTITVLPFQTPNKPTADAGKDQNVNADSSGWASVSLDGSGSSDPAGRQLWYYWKYGQNEYAWGVSPTIQLPAGEHSIELKVFNGELWSDPDYVTITVVSSQVFNTWIYPEQVNPHDDSIYVMTLMDITNIPANQIDLSRPIVLQPGNIVTLGQHVTERNTGDVTATVFAFWDEDDVLAANPSTGHTTLTVQGWLKNGQSFSGNDSVFVSH